MPGLNLTRAEAAERSALISVDSYEVFLDLTSGAETFKSRTSVKFAARTEGSTFIDVVAASLTSAILNGTALDTSGFDGESLHVSPTTGDPSNRVDRAGILVAKYGENLAQADTPEDAHDSLMSSPGHRSVMLGASYTHVGIAALPSHQALIYTLMFGQRVAAANVPKSAAEVEAAFLALRAKNRLKMPSSDGIFRAATESGVAAFDPANPTSDLPLRVMNSTLRAEVKHTHASRGGGCSFASELIELGQLERNTTLLSPTITRYGIAARPLSDAKGTRLFVMMFLEGADCR